MSACNMHHWHRGWSMLSMLPMHQGVVLMALMNVSEQSMRCICFWVQANPTGDSDHPGTEHSLGRVRACVPLRLHSEVAEDALSMPSVQQGVGLPQDREDPAQRLGRSRLTGQAAQRMHSCSVAAAPVQEHAGGVSYSGP